LRLFGTNRRKGWKRKVLNLNLLRLCSTRHTGQLLLQVPYLTSWSLISCHPLSEPCPNLGDLRVGKPTKVFAYLRVRTWGVLPRKKDPISPIGVRGKNPFFRNLEMNAEKMNGFINIKSIAHYPMRMSVLCQGLTPCLTPCLLLRFLGFSRNLLNSS